MPHPAVLLDTDILSELLKQHPLVLQRVRTYLAEHERLAFSIITRYELLRGLKAKQARTQEAAFTLLCQASLILPLTDQVVDRAATLYGELHRQGSLLPDANLACPDPDAVSSGAPTAPVMTASACTTAMATYR